MDLLREQLFRADYRLDSVVTRLGSANDALGRNSTVPARRILGDDNLDVLIRLWLLHDVIPESLLRKTLGDTLSWFLERRFLVAEDSGYRATVEFRPIATDTGIEAWIVADLIPGLDNEITKTRADFVLGASPASTTLSQLASRKPVRRALDLGTGCGIQSLVLAGHAAEIVATDVNPRAIELARISAALSGVSVDFRLGSLYEPVFSEKFDQIVTNPPYVMAPPKLSGLTYREAGFTADDLVRNVIIGAKQHLVPGGSMQVLANWAVVAGQQWQERVTSWITDANCHGLVIMREQLDPAEYVEIWLTDAGLVGDEYRIQYDNWLNYFSQLNIEAVGMGWFSLVKTDDTPNVECEVLPESVIGPIHEALENYHVAQQIKSDSLLDLRLKLRDRVRQETIGMPGAVDPEGISFKQYYGLARRVQADTLLAGVLGACDGELTLGQILMSLAQLLELEVAEVIAEVLPKIRKLVAQDWFDLNCYR